MAVLFKNWEQEEEEEEEEEGCSDRQHINVGEDGKFTALKVQRVCPLVLLVKICWRQGRMLGNKGDEKWIVRVCRRGNKFSIWAAFCVWRDLF